MWLSKCQVWYYKKNSVHIGNKELKTNETNNTSITPGVWHIGFFQRCYQHNGTTICLRLSCVETADWLKQCKLLNYNIVGVELLRLFNIFFFFNICSWFENIIKIVYKSIKSMIESWLNSQDSIKLVSIRVFCITIFWMVCAVRGKIYLFTTLALPILLDGTLFQILNIK